MRGRTFALHLATAAVVTVTRADLQHQPWHGWGTFLLYWFVHYLGLAVFTMFGGALLPFIVCWCLRREETNQPSTDEVVVIIPAVVLLLCVGLLFVKHCGGDSGDDLSGIGRKCRGQVVSTR